VPRKHRRKNNVVVESPVIPARSASAPVREIPLAPLGKRAWLWILIPIVGAVVYANGFSSTLGIDEESGRVTPVIADATSGVGRALTDPGPVAVFTFKAFESMGASARVANHAVNLIIHVLTALTLYGVVRRTLILSQFRSALGEASPWIALVVALIWLVHPLQTESITCIPHRAEALAGLMYLSVLYAVLRSADGKSGMLWQSCAVVACIVGVTGKAIVVTVPLVALLYDRTFLSHSFAEAIRKRKIAHLMMIMIVVSISARMAYSLWSGQIDFTPSTSSALVIEEVSSPSTYLMTQPGVILQYLKLAVWPVPLVFDYAWQPVRDPANALAPILTITAILLWTIWSLVRRRSLGFLAAAFFLILLPTSSIVPQAVYISEHRMYLPLAPIVVCAVAGVYLILRDLTGHKSRSTGRVVIGVACAAVAIAALGYGAIERNGDYRNAESIWADVVAKRPENARAHVGLGWAAIANGDFDKGETSLIRAVEIDPDRADAWTMLGHLLIDQERYDEGIASFEHVIDLRAASADLYRSVAFAYKRLNKYEAAISSYAMASWLDPDDADTYVELGNIQLETGDFNKALGYYDAALELEPGHILAMVNKAAIFVEQNRFRDAITLYDDVLSLDPERETACESRDYVLSLLSGAFEDADVDAVENTDGADSADETDEDGLRS